MKQLFIDDHIIEESNNLARKLHQPEKFHGNAVIRPEYRWENQYIRIWSAPVWDPDDNLFKLIYYGTATGSTGFQISRLDKSGEVGAGKSFSCYATSTDGVNWEKPFLGLYDYEELNWDRTPIGKNNNILPSFHGSIRGLIYDSRDPDPNRKFKSLAYSEGGLHALVSADCQNWEKLDLPPLPSADVSELYFDEDQNRFIATVKHKGPYGRSFYLSTSEDFEHWSEQELVFHADQIDQENGMVRLGNFFENPNFLTPVYNRSEEWRTDVYHFPVFRYQGLYIALPVMHHWSGKHPPLYENVDSRKSVELASSRDLRHWNRVADRAPFLELSPIKDGSAYDTGQIGTTNGVVIRNNELWFYYIGMKHRSLSIADTMNQGYLDSSAICMARLRMDGFVSLKGGIEWGSLLTKPTIVEGKDLHVNVDSWRGKVVVEILDISDGNPIPGFTKDECIPAVIDNINETIRWKCKPDLSELSGKTIRIRFWLLKAELYSFWFTD